MSFIIPVIILFPICLVIFFLLYTLNDSFYLHIQKYIFNEQIIVCRMISGEWFRTVLRTSPFGDLVTYRYPLYDIGRIILYENGTGDYFGKIEWKIEE